MLRPFWYDTIWIRVLAHHVVKGPLITAIVISECVNFLFVAHDKHDRYEKGYIQQQYHWLLW